MEKGLKNKRMSLDPAKNPLIGLQKHHNATELEVRQTMHDESQSIINKESESYPSEEAHINLFRFREYSKLSLKATTGSIAKACTVCFERRDMGIIYMLPSK